jgi:hypothetical protein
LAGIALTGISLAGIALTGIALAGIALTGISLAGIALTGISLAGIALTALARITLALALRIITHFLGPFWCDRQFSRTALPIKAGRTKSAGLGRKQME